MKNSLLKLKALVVLLIIFFIFVGCKSEVSNSIANSTNTDSSFDSKNVSDLNLAKNGEIAPEIVRIVDAYKTNDYSKLTDAKDIYVFNKAKEIIALVIKSNMTDYEKELAIHDYIILNSHYDLDELNERVEVNPDSFNAYGLLKNGKSVCLGYTRTFQLFMDMLNIECLTIHSAAHGDQHAWNMIKLDGDWYHVDVTWDDPIPDSGNFINHNFMNVTTKYMKETEHEWDATMFPKAIATKYKYSK